MNAARASQRQRTDQSDFEGLFERELSVLGLASEKVACTGSVATDDQWVRALPHDLFGLALSGGGIRSATFNLGLLQSLHGCGLLDRVQYLSTVSGGGYIGGWWSAYLKRQPRVLPSAGVGPPRFPVASSTGQEGPEVRHLREFSRFLAPRWGMFTIERWLFIAAAVTAAVPALAFAAAAVVSAVLLWQGLLDVLKASSPLVGLLVLLVLTSVALLHLERRTARNEEVDHWSPNSVGYSFFSIAAGVLLVLGWTMWHPYRGGADEEIWAWYPAGLWAAIALCLILLRFLLLSRFELRLGWLIYAPLDRIIARLLVLGILWAAVGAIWLVAEGARTISVAAVGFPAAVAAVLPWLRRLITHRFNRAQTGRLRERVARIGPKLLFLVAVVAAVTLAAAVVRGIGQGDRVTAVLLTVGVLVVGLLAFRPNRTGLHAFYLSRISRTFLGASNYVSRKSSNRETTDQAQDDFPLTELRTQQPIHLICCAANDTAGNLLAGLYRGAQSAVLSGLGLCVGRRWFGWPPDPRDAMTLGAALTASGAAFNSLMGAKSVEYGPSSSFVLAALNLRLGLWISPLRADAHWSPPGYLFFSELVGHSKATGGTYHLSDGGHFDNTAAYELIRRHCRFVVLADCGADPHLLFDDLGNLIRRVREDFGVEIALDIDPLRKALTGRSRGHVVVGELDYPDGTQGTIVLVKPTLVGDESADVLQYSGRNTAFPHDSTGNQFYDEKQWESYRRLGEHSGRTLCALFGSFQEADSTGEIFRRVTEKSGSEGTTPPRYS